MSRQNRESPDSTSSHMVALRNGICPPVSRHYITNASTSVFGSPAFQSTAAIRRQTAARCDNERGFQDQADEDSDTVINKETIMAATISDNGTMGCAFFSTQDNRLFVAQDVTLADAPTMQHFLEHVQPSSILIPAKFPNDMTEIIDTYVDRSYQGQSLGYPTKPTTANSSIRARYAESSHYYARKLRILDLSI